MSCFTCVAEGTSKTVVRLDGYVKTLFVKKGYKLDQDGEVVQLQKGEKPQYPDFLGGLRWVSLLKPLGIDKIYTRPMKYVKAFPDGSFEQRSDKKIDFILTGTQYQYGLRFESMADSNGLPLSGKMTMTAMITNPYKAQFLVKDWFDASVSRVLPRVREYISEHTYDQIINDHTVQLDADVFKTLNQVGPNGEPSIVFTVKDKYGLTILALETVSVDPPEVYRKATLANWEAGQVATKETQETAGRILRSVAMLAHISEEELRKKLDGNPNLRGIPNSQGGYKEDFERAWDLLKRDRAGGGLKDIRVSNADGTKLDPATATLATIIGLFKDSGNSGGSTTSSQKGNRPKGGSSKRPEDMNLEELREWGQSRKVRKRAEDMTDEELEKELDEFDK